MAQAKYHPIPTSHVSQPVWEMRSATEADMRYLAPRLAKGSLAEMACLSKFQPVSVLLQDMARKGVIIDRRKPSQPVAVFDVAPIPDQTAGSFWSALTEDLLVSEWLWTLTDRFNAILNMLQSNYPALLTYVDTRNVEQIKWLGRVGFNAVEDVPQFGRHDLPFKIYKRAVA